MVSIEFHLRPSARGEEVEGRLFVRVIAARRVASISLPYRLYRGEWDEKRKCVLLEDIAKERREYLDEVAVGLEKDRRLLREIKEEIDKGEETTSRRIVEVFKMRRFKSGFRRIAESLSDELLLLGRQRTARAYRSSLFSLLSYLGKEDITWGELSYPVLKGFENFLKAKGRSLNTVSFYMRNLRAMYNKGVKHGWITGHRKDLFEGLYTGVAPSKKRALSTAQMKQLENLLEDPLELEEEEREALSLFLFSFHGRGISFVDLAYLKKEDIKKDKLLYRRKKTGTALEVELSPVMKNIIGLFEKKTENSPFLFPLIHPGTDSYYRSYTGALRKQNMLLSRIAKKAVGIESLSTHMARHSWATIAKRKNIPLWVISEALGHRDLKTTYIYMDSFEKKVIHKAARKVSGSILRYLS